jgi:hypothetical protein
MQKYNYKDLGTDVELAAEDIGDLWPGLVDENGLSFVLIDTEEPDGSSH